MQFLLMILLAACIFAAGFGAGAMETSGVVASTALAAQQKQFEVDRKADHDAAAVNLKAAVAAVTVNTHNDEIIAAVNASSQTIMERIRHAPKSVACVNSPVIRAYLDSVRTRQRGRTNAVRISRVAVYGVP